MLNTEARSSGFAPQCFIVQRDFRLLHFKVLADACYPRSTVSLEKEATGCIPSAGHACNICRSEGTCHPRKRRHEIDIWNLLLSGRVNQRNFEGIVNVLCAESTFPAHRDFPSAVPLVLHIDGVDLNVA